MIRKAELFSVKKKIEIIEINFSGKSFSLRKLSTTNKNIKSDLIVNSNKCLIPDASPYQRIIKCNLPSCGCRISPFIWISKELKSIYFETPKVASSSIRKLLGIKVPNLFFILIQVLLTQIKQKRYTIRIKLFYQTIEEKETYIFLIKQGIKSFKHHFDGNILNLGFSKYNNEQALFEPFYGSPIQAIQQYPNFFSFAIARFPISRIISNWKMFASQKHRGFVFEELFNKSQKEVSFNEFIIKLSTIKNHHWHQQVDFLPFDSTKKLHLSYLGRLESLNTDWELISQKIGFNKPLLKLNSTNNQNTIPDTKELEIIIELYQNDFELLYPEYLK